MVKNTTLALILVCLVVPVNLKPLHVTRSKNMLQFNSIQFTQKEVLLGTDSFDQCFYKEDNHHIHLYLTHP